MNQKIDYSAVGLRLKQFRKEKGITQEDVAKGLGVTVAYISNMENHKVKLNLRVLSYYAKLLHVSIDYLLYADRSTVSALDAELLSMVETLTAEEKEKLVKVLRVLKDS